ncbi:restriction endonuclease subunit S [Vibrio cholerae]|nr:restriction endonuclease subunit S [Vibrio cholerae]
MTGRYKAYPEYKSTDEVWLGNVPSHWRDLKINRLTIVKRGASPRPIDDPKYFDEAGEYSWVRIADVTASDTYLEHTPQRLSPLGASLSVKLEPNELFLSIAGTVGKPCINKIKACIHDGFVYFPEYKENTKFLFYIFAAGEAYKGLGKFGTQLNLNTETVGGIKIGIPCIEEQHKIANFLDHETAKIDTLIDKQEKLIELLKEKRQAVISHAVTKGLNPDAPMKNSGVEWLGEVPEHWEVTRAKFVSKIFVPQRNKPELNSNNIGTPWATMDDMKSDFILSTHHTVSDEALKSAGSKVLPKGSVIASCVGNFGVASINKIDVVINQQLQAYIPKRISSLYLRELVSISKCYFELVGTAATLVYVNQQGFENLPITLPSIEEQQDITDYLTAQKGKFDKLIVKCFNQVELMKERKTALISAAVTGKIDVRDWQPSPTKVS